MKAGQPPKYTYIVGEQIDDLVITSIEKDKNGWTVYNTKCAICGREKIMKGATIARHSGTTHKACGKGLKTKDPLFHEKWIGMRSRTNNPNSSHYKDYGARGINSDQFENFIDFYDLMYPSYCEAYKKLGDKISLERIDVDGNYCVENCTWIDVDEQKGNQRKTVYFEITDENGVSAKYKNIRKFSRDNGYNDRTISDLVSGKLKHAYGLTGRRITKQEFEQSKSVTTN